MIIGQLPSGYALTLGVTACRKSIEEYLAIIRVHDAMATKTYYSEIEVKEAKQSVELLGIVADWLFRLSMVAPLGEEKMKAEEIVPERLYAIAGQGPMRVRKLHPHSIECETLDGLTYWAGYDQVIRKVPRAYVRTWVEQLIRAKIVPADYTTALERGPDDEEQAP